MFLSFYPAHTLLTSHILPGNHVYNHYRFGEPVKAATPPFCSPEIVKAGYEDMSIAADPSQDVYSLGILLKMLFFGIAFYSSESMSLPGVEDPEGEKAIDHNTHQARDYKENLPSHLPSRNLVLRMTKERPDERMKVEDIMVGFLVQGSMESGA